MRPRPTALRIPCPWDGAGPVPWTYPWWSRLYGSTRRLRHRIGLHDWEHLGPLGNDRYEVTRCTWCGQRAEEDR